MKSSTALFTLGILSLSGTITRADQLNVLGTAESFAVMGASTVTNTGSSVLYGDVGLYPGTSLTGFSSASVMGGSIYINDASALTAQADALIAFNHLAGLSTTSDLTGTDLGGMTLTPGVYSFNSSAQLTGTVTLDFGGLSDQSFLFQTGSTLTTASASAVSVLNEGTDDSIYWEVGSSATLGTTTAFEGILIAAQSVTLDTGATIGCGSVMALNAAVTLDTNTIGGGCSAQTGGTPTPVDGGSPSAVPEPSSVFLLGSGLLGTLAAARRRFAAL